MSIAVSIDWDEAGMTRVMRTMGGFEGVRLQRAVDKAMGVAMRPWTGYMRSGIAGSGIARRDGSYARSPKVRRARKRPGEAAAWTAGPTDYTRHWLAQGHRIVTPGGRDTGRRSRAFPWLDGVVARYAGATVEVIESVTFATAIRG